MNDNKNFMRVNLFVKGFIIVCLLIGNSCLASNTDDTDNEGKGNKGKLFFYWGWNRGAYSKSNIHFKGEGYDFVLKKVIAKDRQTPFDSKIYFNPLKITIPQTNFKVGYHFWDQYNIAIGFDHMKYVMENDQVVEINGYMQSFNPAYNKTFENEKIVLDEDFLQYEHTDGLNYINLEVNRVDRLYSRWDEKMQLQSSVGFNAGAMVPRSDVMFIHYDRNDEYHLTGFGTSIKLGLNLILFKGFSILSEYKFGYINMPGVHPTNVKGDRAKQSFLFFQYNILFGGIIKIK